MDEDAGSMTGGRKSLFYALAFVGGSHVMLLEMCAFRVLGVTFGSAVYVTGTLLSLVMVALSVGYLAGGRASRRYTSLRYLVGSLAVCVIYFNVTNVWIREKILDWGYAIGQHSRDAGHSGFGFAMAPALATLCMYAVPMCLLSQITPFLISLSAVKDQKAGVLAGNLMAISTAGSIIGTLLGSFVLLPTLGVNGTHLVFAGTLLVLMTVIELIDGRAGRERTLAVTLVLIAAVTLVAFKARIEANWALPPGLTLIYQHESTYGTLKLFEKVYPETGDHIYKLKTSRHATMSVGHPSAPLQNGWGMGQSAFGELIEAKDVLVLGTSIGASLRALEVADPTRSITGVEIDPDVIALSEKYNDVKASAHVRLFAEDARVFVRSDDHLYDYVIVDLYNNDSLPPHCISAEFFAAIRRRLRPTGVMFVNFCQAVFEWDEGIVAQKFSPREHLFAAIRAAGFPALYEDRSIDQGFINAFARDVSLEEVRRKMRAVMDDAKRPLEVREALAQKYFYLVRIPDDASGSKPVTDDWVPIPEIQRGQYANPERAAALAMASSRPEWGQQAGRDGAAGLRLIGAKHLAAHWQTRRELGVDDGPYCDDVRAWISRQPSYPIADLARYMVETPCLGTPNDAVATDPKVAVFQLVRQALDKFDTGRPDALVALRAAVDAADKLAGPGRTAVPL